MKYVFDISGYMETVLSLRQAEGPRRRGRELAHAVSGAQAARFVGAELVADALKTLSAPAGIAPDRPAQAYFLKGQLHAFEGEMALAIEAFEEAMRIAVSAEVRTCGRNGAKRSAIAHLHKAEMENGVLHSARASAVCCPST